MILYGRDLSPFTRRVAVWCALYGHAPERRSLAATDPADFPTIQAANPVGRVPVLELEDGTQLVDSVAICDWLDEGADPGVRLVPAAGIPRRDCLQRIALAQGTVEKAVAMVYERNRRPEEHHWPAWQERLTTQIRGGLAAMEAGAPGNGWMGGAGPDGSDLVAAIVLQFVETTNPWLLAPGYPKLAALADRAMGIEAVAATKP